MVDVFISYSSKDRAFASQVAQSLEQNGYDVWFDRDDIRAGEIWDDAIQRGLQASQVMLLIVSPNAMQSSHVKDEWSYFHSKGKPIIPLRLQDAEVHFQLHRLQRVDFQEQPFSAGFEQLVQELNRYGLPHKQTVEINVSVDNSGNNANLMTVAIVAIVALLVIFAGVFFALDQSSGTGTPVAVVTEDTATEVVSPIQATEEAAAEAPNPTEEVTAVATETIVVTEEGTIAPVDCPNSPPPRLEVGGQAQVASGFGFSNLRANPESSDIITEIPRGNTFAVLEGPVCGVGLERSWWRVRYQGEIGWVAEGTGTETYWLVPVE